MHARLVPNLELAERHARKAFRIAPVLTADEPFDHVHAVHVVLNLEERVEQEQLPDGVDDVGDLDHHVRRDQIVAVELSADEAARLGDEVLDADDAAGAVLALRQQVAVHLVDDVADRLLANLEVGGLRADASGVHDRRHVDAGAFVEEAPEQARYEREQALEDEYQRHPLVVADHLLALLLGELLGGYRVVHRQVVGVRNPADGVGVVAMGVGELRRAPAGDRPTDELLRADEETETDEDDDGVLSTETVDVVIVHAKLHLAYRQRRLE